jgi:hypothetical protein
VLFVMETAEQLALRGGTLGHAVWLGAPVAISLAAHAISCVAFTWLLARSARSLAKTTLRVLQMIRAIATMGVASAGVVRRVRAEALPCKDTPLLCRIGERGPPALLAYSR